LKLRYRTLPLYSYDSLTFNYISIADGQYRGVIVDDTKAEERRQYFRGCPVPRWSPEQRSLQRIGCSSRGSTRQRKHHTDVSNCLITALRYGWERAIDHVPFLYYNDRAQGTNKWAMGNEQIWYSFKEMQELDFYKWIWSRSKIPT